MKKYNLLKVLAITVFVTWLLTLVIPGGYVDYSGAVTIDKIASVGIWGVFSNLSISISYFNAIAVLLIAVASFYAILNKVEVYNNFVQKVASIFENKKKLLFVITALVFGILSLFVSDFILLIVFAPFIYNVMMKLSIDKKSFLSSTLVAALIGSMCGIYNGDLFTLLSIEVNTLLLVKVIVFVLSMVALIFFTAPKVEKKVKVAKETKKTTKKETKTTKAVKTVKVEKEDKKVRKVKKVIYAILTLVLGTIGVNKFYAKEIKAGLLRLLFCWTGIPTILSIAEFIAVLTEKADKKGMIAATSKRRENVSFGVITALFTIFLTGAIIPWESLFEGFTLFTDFNTFLGNIKIGDYTVFSNIIGAPLVTSEYGSSGVITAIGSWRMADVAIFLFIATIVIAIANKLTVNESISSVTNGIKKILPVAITAMLISIVLVICVTTGINVTICKVILSITKEFNIVTATIASIICSIFTADFYYFVSAVGSIFAATVGNQDYYGVVAFMLQSLYNFTMILAPTSVGLVIGLYYLDIPYNKWFKFIWKTLLALFIIIMIATIVIYALV